MIISLVTSSNIKEVTDEKLNEPRAGKYEKQLGLWNRHHVDTTEWLAITPFDTPLKLKLNMLGLLHE